MKCSCGRNLKRIAVDCYECELCGLKQAVGFLKAYSSVNVPKLESPSLNNREIKILHMDCDSKSNETIIEIEESVCNAIGINKKIFQQ